MSSRSEPRYLSAWREGVLAARVRTAVELLGECRLCPRRCGVDRRNGGHGYCRTGRKAWVASHGSHFGEETPLVGTHGSGTIFFSLCNLRCLFCQNFDISHHADGREVSAGELAGIMLRLQEEGCHNINLVTPSHVVPQIIEALEVAVENGLRLPLVFNTGGYDAVETLRLLDGLVDIYMPDFKFWDEELARRLCEAPDYPETARNALREMHRQVGDLFMDERGIARSGLLVRHLVLPGGLAGTAEVARFIAREISARTFVNVMAQYRPLGRAGEVEELDRFPSRREVEMAVAEARSAGLHQIDEPMGMSLLD